MDDDGYTKAKLEDIEKTLIRIEAKIDKINGRVDKLEQWRAGIVAIGGLLVFAVPIVIKLFWS